MDEDQQPLDGYPPDPVEDQPGQHVPTPRAARARGVLQAHKPKSKARKRVAKGSSRIISQQKRRQALEYRKAGMTYAQIAEQIGYANASGAAKAVKKAFGEVIQEPVAELKAIQIERLNHMLLTLWAKVSTGDEVAINTSLRIMDKIDALMGTEHARQVEVTNNNAVLVIDGNKDDYLAALKKMTGAGVQPDGTNSPNPTTHPMALPSAPAPTHNYPPGMAPAQTPYGQGDADIVDAEVVHGDVIDRDEAEAVVEAEPVKTQKKFSWGVDPKAKPRPKGERKDGDDTG